MQNLLIRGSRGGDVRKLKQALIKQLGADAAAFGGLATGDELDADTEAALRRWQAGVGLVADGVMGPYCQTVLGLRPVGFLALTLDVVRRLFPATKPANIARYLPYVATALEASAGLTTAYAWKATGLSATPNCCNPSTAMPNVLPRTRWACTTALNWRRSPTCRRRFSQPVRCMRRPTPTAAGTP